MIDSLGPPTWKGLRGPPPSSVWASEWQRGHLKVKGSVGSHSRPFFLYPKHASPWGDYLALP